MKNPTEVLRGMPPRVRRFMGATLAAERTLTSSLLFPRLDVSHNCAMMLECPDLMGGACQDCSSLNGYTALWIVGCVN